MAIKIPLLDPLGLPVSPEVSWETIGRGTSDIFSAAGDTLKEIAGINEGPVSKEDLEKTTEMVSNRVEGSISGFQKPRRKEDTDSQQVKTEQEILALHHQNQVRQSIEQKRIEINSKFGIGNVLYGNTVSEDGEVRTDVQTYIDRVNSELSTEQLKTKREVTVAQARGKVERIAGADMKRDFEDRNMGSPG